MDAGTHDGAAALTAMTDLATHALSQESHAELATDWYADYHACRSCAILGSKIPRSAICTPGRVSRGSPEASTRAFYFLAQPDSLRFVRILVGLAGHVPARLALALAAANRTV